MSDVKFLNVVAKDGSTAAERFAAMEKDSYTFYFVGTDDLYFGAKKITNAADLATAITAIGNNTAAITLLNNTESTEGSVRYIIADYLDNLTAADIAIEDTAGNFDSTDVEGALAELAEASAGGVESKTVYLTDESAGQTEYAKVYKLYQGADASDMRENVLVGTINLAKDKVVQSGQVVVNPSGQPAGTYIELILQNVDNPLYINVADLVDAYTGGTTAEATVAISSDNEITVTINTVAATKVIYQEASGGDPAVTVKTKIDNVEAKVDAIDVAGDIADAIAELDATPSQVAGSDGLALSLTEVDGVITAISGSIASGTYDLSGAAATAKSEVIGSASDTSTDLTLYGVKAAAADASSAASTADGKAVAAQNDVDALETLVGTLPSGITATTVTGYVAEAVGTALTWEEV